MDGQHAVTRGSMIRETSLTLPSLLDEILCRTSGVRHTHHGEVKCDRRAEKPSIMLITGIRSAEMRDIRSSRAQLTPAIRGALKLRPHLEFIKA
jgi:hypothetical protein